MDLLETYFTDIAAIHSSGAGTDETAYYAVLGNLLNAIGKEVKPKVRCIMGLRNQGDGLPDGGLFTADQFKKSGEAKPSEGQIPNRGVIEAKSPAENTSVTIGGTQVMRYFGRYRQVLVTNYRDFVLVGPGEGGSLTRLESYTFASTEEGFWADLKHPRIFAEKHSVRFSEYIKRVYLHATTLTQPKDVAWFLASYARDAKARIESAQLGALDGIKLAFSEGLGLSFEGVKNDPLKGEHFFRSTLVQTLFYGLFSGWVLWSRQNPANSKQKFDWRLTAHYIHVPILRKLFYEIAEPGFLEQLNLPEVMDWATGVLNRIERESFFASFAEEHAVQYFYEPFLQEFDPELRKELGVWYTPHEIVKYMVARVDKALRDELGIADGLADRNVVVLDPCCGTGAYLIEVLRTIAATLQKKGSDALTSADLKRAAMERVFGFEILPAPFVVSHMQLGTLLQSLGAPLDDKSDERVGVYLTNALTGWEPPKEPKAHLPFIELEEERDAADRVKRDSPILVIIGNPPYNAFAGVSPKEEEGLVEPYKSGLNSEWNVKKFNLDELYVRFFRVAERRITERTGRGIICYITSYSYLTEPSFVVLRKRLLEGFDTLWFDCLNGDSRETGKISPDGTPDPSVFSTDLNREGIRLGTAIGLTIRKGKREGPSSVHYREFWGINKRTDLLGNLNLSASPNPYKTVIPTKANRFIFQSSKVAPEYLTWPRLTDLSSIDPITGYKENRGFSLLADEKKALIERMTRYYNKTITWAVLQKDNNGLTRDAARFDAKKTRAKILELEEFSPERLHPYILRPFEMKWCYYTSVRSLWNEPRPALYQHQFPGNRFFVSRPSGVSSPEGPPFYFHSCLGDFDFIRGHAYHFPIRLRPIASTGGKPIPSNQGSLGGDLESTSQSAQPNFSSDSTSYLRNLSGQSSSDFNVKAEWLWLHALAIGYSPLYLSENADGIRMDWPRIPLPNSEKALLLSVDLGRQIADLLDERTDIKGVTVNGARPELSALAVISNTRSGALNEAAGDLSLTAGWGHTSENRITMPGRGKVVERDYSRNELDLMHKRAATTGSNIGQLQALLGKSTCDIYLNDHAYWGNVPMKVWDYNIGGYQVLKKWLSYRESSTLGRPLSLDEVRGFMNVARRIAAIILLQPDLDKNYIQTKSNCYDWNVST